jgi:cold shock CspA family protein
VSLVRKLHALGVRVMLLSWDFDFLADNGKQMVTRTSQDLLEEVTYPLVMHELIDNGLRKSDPVIANIFVAGESRKKAIVNPEDVPEGAETSVILSLKNGFGFIRYPPNNLFFHHSSLVNADFNDIEEGDTVAFNIGTNDEGEEIAIDVQTLS